MDDQVVSIVKRKVPKINSDIAKGLAVKHMAHTEKYVNSVFEVAAKNFPPELKYDGCERCTPEEEFHFATAKKNSKRLFDVARNDMFLMKFHFSFNGVPLKTPRYAYLPFVGDSGSCVLNGTRYFITPTLTDSTFSPSDKGVFIRLLRDKLNFERTPYHVFMNNRSVTVQMVHSLIYHNKNKEYKPSVKAECSVAHYLFCKYGVGDAFKRFAGVTPVIGNETDITEQLYPDDCWTIFRSRKVKPSGYGKQKYFGNNIIVMAIPNDKINKLTLALVAGFYYVTDHFAHNMQADWVNEPKMWRIILGHILFGSDLHTGWVIEEISDHINSLDDYVDNIVKEKLHNDGYNCNDIYELFIVVLNNIDDWVRMSPKTINSMYGKELSVLYDALYPITSSIFDTYFKLKAKAKRGLKERDVETIMNTRFRARALYGLTKGNGCAKLESYSGDNEFFGITTNLVPKKTSNSRTGARERPSLRDSSKRLHVSVAEVGGFSNLPKNEPDGRACINPHVKIDERGRIIRDPEKAQMLDRIQEMLTDIPTV